MKVWVVEPIGYDSYGIMGIFATPEAAKAAYSTSGDWLANGDEWVTEGADACANHGYSIYSVKVREA